MVKPSEIKEKLLKYAEHYIDGKLNSNFNGYNELKIDIISLCLHRQLIDEIINIYTENGWKVRWERDSLYFSA